jgi:hypothetical protein
MTFADSLGHILVSFVYLNQEAVLYVSRIDKVPPLSLPRSPSSSTGAHAPTSSLLGCGLHAPVAALIYKIA